MDKLLEFLDAPEQTFRFEYDQAKGMGSHVGNDPIRSPILKWGTSHLYILPHAEFGQNDHREDAPQFSTCM